MAEKQKKHDLRDDIYAPSTTVTDLNERLAGAESPAVDAEKGDGDMPLVSPASRVPDGAATKG
jgi:hypothetical protein